MKRGTILAGLPLLMLAIGVLLGVRLSNDAAHAQLLADYRECEATVDDAEDTLRECHRVLHEHCMPWVQP